ncbi:MAG: aldehyde ferredoxin oxidoreductase family protein [Candidatus Bathyarchaeia archaeon]
MGRILRINLTSKRFTFEPLKDEVLRKFIGGRGLGAWILWNELSPGTNALGPGNKLVISAGPLAGTKAQGAHRLIVQFKSPLTGTYFRSVCGGFFAAEMKFAGYDALIIEGAAEKPTYVYIHDDGLEFRDASTVWGMTTDNAAEFLHDETDRNARMLIIGPAGERLVKFAAIVTDNMRTASRGGGGAVMGSKNLKAIVIRGDKRPEIYDEKAFDDLVIEQIDKIRSSPAFEPLRNLGTSMAVYPEYLGGCCPTYNYRQKELPNADVFDPENISRYVVKHYGCFGCMIRCGKKFRINRGPYAGFVGEMPEYETLWSFGANLGNTNIESIIYANMLADSYGLDTISCGVAIGFMMELYEKGIISKGETGGLELRWGNPDVIPELVRMIALRIGIGNLLAEGVREAARVIGRGAERYAMHIKGLELPGHDPRRAKSRGLSLLTSPIGASHTMGGFIGEERGFPYKGKHIDPFAAEGKGEITKETQCEHALIETGVWCLFVGMNTELYSKILYAATGVEDFKRLGTLLAIGERILNLERAFNVREGIDGRYDKMPERITKEPIPRPAPSKGQVFEEEILLKDYYRACEWDEKGRPTKKKLIELGLEDVAREIYP